MTGLELKRALRALHLKQKEFASLIDYREETVSRWIRDRKAIPAAVIIAVRGMVDRQSQPTPD